MSPVEPTISGGAFGSSAGPEGKDIADAVDLDVKPGGFRPSDEMVATELVGSGGGQPCELAVSPAADLAQCAQA